MHVLDSLDMGKQCNTTLTLEICTSLSHTVRCIHYARPPAARPSDLTVSKKRTIDMAVKGNKGRFTMFCGIALLMRLK